MTLATEELRAWIGREAVYDAPEELGRASIRSFALAVGDDNPLWVDDDYARTNGYAGVIAPPTLVCETNQFVQRPPDADGYIGHTWDLPFAGRAIRGGNAYTFHRPVVPADRVRTHWRINEIDERTSSSGASLLVVVSTATYTGSKGDPLAVNRETLLLTDGAGSAGGSRPVTEAGGEALPRLKRTISLPDMVAYAGATWDWHRLHYDAAYVAAMGLPGPVVDGQMLGALMAEQILDHFGPRAFITELQMRFRGMVFAGDTVEVSGGPIGDGEIRVAQRVMAGDRLAADGTATVRL